VGSLKFSQRDFKMGRQKKELILREREREREMEILFVGLLSISWS
jgi:hypothetical protein